ncbi:hypothetical protein FVE85_6638 [Porphyridium purpureum]|uniref:Uncharacterized protein n=1 Tax=Porphyridium purpureum TaxID=35688 RepID=A0A5J4Z8A3_PORPP|nr:hypothetical protein FVE85_6638 [Porphyridium purpureum]|eukprot:POR2200..scf295_1
METESSCTDVERLDFAIVCEIGDGPADAGSAEELQGTVSRELARCMPEQYMFHRTQVRLTSKVIAQAGCLYGSVTYGAHVQDEYAVLAGLYRWSATPSSPPAVVFLSDRADGDLLSIETADFIPFASPSALEPGRADRDTWWRSCHAFLYRGNVFYVAGWDKPRASELAPPSSVRVRFQNGIVRGICAEEAAQRVVRGLVTPYHDMGSRPDENGRRLVDLQQLRVFRIRTFRCAAQRLTLNLHLIGACLAGYLSEGELGGTEDATMRTSWVVPASLESKHDSDELYLEDTEVVLSLGAVSEILSDPRGMFATCVKWSFEHQSVCCASRDDHEMLEKLKMAIDLHGKNALFSTQESHDHRLLALALGLAIGFGLFRAYSACVTPSGSTLYDASSETKKEGAYSWLDHLNASKRQSFRSEIESSGHEQEYISESEYIMRRVAAIPHADALWMTHISSIANDASNDSVHRAQEQLVGVAEDPQMIADMQARLRELERRANIPSGALESRHSSSLSLEEEEDDLQQDMNDVGSVSPSLGSSRSSGSSESSGEYKFIDVSRALDHARKVLGDTNTTQGT